MPVADLRSGKPGTRSPWCPYVMGRCRPCFRPGPYLLPLGAHSPANYFLCMTTVPTAVRVHKTVARLGPGLLLDTVYYVRMSVNRLLRGSCAARRRLRGGLARCVADLCY